MEINKVFMVSTNDIYLEGYDASMTDALSAFYPDTGVKRSKTFKALIPFVKTNSKKNNEYLEMITETLYYKYENKFVSKDGFVSFDKILNYNKRMVDKSYDSRSMFLVCLTMEEIYRQNGIKYKKRKYLNPILSKIKRK